MHRVNFIAHKNQLFHTFTKLNFVNDSFHLVRFRRRVLAVWVIAAALFLVFAGTFEASAAYVPSGSLISSIFDTRVLGGASINTIIWQGTRPLGTNVKFQIASSNNINGPWNYLGPSGTTSPIDVYGPDNPSVPRQIVRKYHYGHRYIRYKVILETSDPAVTPEVTDIVIGWSF